MKKLSYAAVAAAIAFSNPAAAHEFVCEKTVNGDVVHEIRTYPEKLNFKVTITNTHPTAASTALSVRDDLMTSLGLAFTPAPPFTVAAGKSAEFGFEVTVRDEAECLTLSRAQACAASFEDRHAMVHDSREIGVGKRYASVRMVADDLAWARFTVFAEEETRLRAKVGVSPTI